MHPEDIKAALRKTGTTATSLARGLGVSDAAIYYVIHSRRRSIRIARRICEIARLDPEQVWPGRYPEFRISPVRPQTNYCKKVS